MGSKIKPWLINLFLTLLFLAGIGAAHRILQTYQSGKVADLLERAKGEQTHGNLAGALELYQKAQKLDPNNPLIWTGLGDLALSEKDCQKALEYYERIAKKDSGLQLKLVEANLCLAHVDTAKKLLSQLDATSSQNLMGVILRFESAQQEGDVYSQTLSANELIKEGHPQLALPILGIVLQKMPEYRDAYLLFATAQAQTGELEGAATTLQKALSLDPTHAHTYQLGAQIYAALGDDAKATEYQEKAKKME